MALRLVFMGTPDFAAEILRHVVEAASGTDWEVVGVYSQPDRPCGRGRVCKPTAVKKTALEHGLDVYQPETFRTATEMGQAATDELAALTPDVLLVAAYGLILPQHVLDIPTHGAVNVHASLLPKYRGAAPIQRAILDGERVTGISIMQMEAGLDTGPVLLARALKIGENDTASDLHDQLANMGGRMLVETLHAIEAGTAVAQPQDDARATYATKLDKSEGFIDWNQPARHVHDRIRAMHPWPGAYFTWLRPPEGHMQGGQAQSAGDTPTNDPAGQPVPVKLSVTPGRVGPPLSAAIEPGTFLGIRDNHIAIACADATYLTPAIKPQGKKAMDANAFFCGYLSRCCLPEQ